MADKDRQSTNHRQNDGVEENPSSVTQRLTQILMGEGDDDLLLQGSDRDDGVLQWIRALDMQVMGACRADERLKPLLKLNSSSGVMEDRLLAQLSQHFEPSEVGMLARCLCIPLVSMRVGKISKQGSLLSPTSVRGNLCLTLLPTSDMRISFNGDEGSTERLATLSTQSPCVAIEIEEISVDKSGRSFAVKTSDSTVTYYWCSEKSKLLGDELLRKMKDLLVRRPSLAELTGISESRLNCFATNLRSHLSGSVLSNAEASNDGTGSSEFSDDSSEHHYPSSSQKGSVSFQNGSQGSKTHLIYQGSLSPRLNSFKDGLPKSSSSKKGAIREKLRGPCESSNVFSPISLDLSTLNSTGKEKIPEASEVLKFSGVSFPFSGQETEVTFSGPSHFSVSSALQYTLENLQLPFSSTESLSLPPLSSLLSATMPSKPSLNLASLPPISFPGLLPDPLVRFPTLPTSQHIPTFTPFICDPIIHIPVIDVCSSGQGYLVSSGHALSTTIPSLLPNTESMVEKSARETLRMLINSSNQPTDVDDMKHLMGVGSRGLYDGTRDIDAINNSMSILWSSDGLIGGGIGRRFGSRDDLNDILEKPSSSDDPSCSDDWLD